MSAVRVNVTQDNLKEDVMDPPATYVPPSARKHGVKQHFKEYAEGTSLHGIKYIGEDGRHLCERYFNFFLLKSILTGA